MVGSILEPIGYEREQNALAGAKAYGVETTAEEISLLNAQAPNLVSLLAMSHDSPEQLAELITSSPLAAIADDVAEQEAAPESGGLPIVVAHGMGDSCFNSGMKSITKESVPPASLFSAVFPSRFRPRSER